MFDGILHRQRFAATLFTPSWGKFTPAQAASCSWSVFQLSEGCAALLMKLGCVHESLVSMVFERINHVKVRGCTLATVP